MQFKFILSLVLTAFGAVLALQNAGSVPLRFFAWSFEISLALIILLSIILGAVISALLSLVKQFSLQNTIRDQQKSLSDLQQQNEQLQGRYGELESASQQYLQSFEKDLNGEILLDETNALGGNVVIPEKSQPRP